MIYGMVEGIFAAAPELASAKWIASDGQPNDPRAWRPETTGPSDLALLQYTSGSTREPRGVMLTHANLMHNQRLINEAFGHTATAVSWLPIYHDMGLIGHVIQPLFAGIVSIMMSPLDFLQSPFRWLSAISEYRANGSGAPNFAYELCTRKVTDEQIRARPLELARRLLRCRAGAQGHARALRRALRALRLQGVVVPPLLRLG